MRCHSELRRLPFQLLMAISLAFFGCGAADDDPANPQPSKDQSGGQFPPTREYGSLGEHESSSDAGTWVARIPYFRDGERQLVIGTLNTPQESAQAVFALIMKLPNAFEIDTRLSNNADGDDHILTVSWGTSAEERLAAQFRYTNLKSPVEASLTLAGEKYDFGDGRVFLIDLAASPATVQQLDVEIPLRDPLYIHEDKLKSLLDDLVAADVRIQDFLRAE